MWPLVIIAGHQKANTVGPLAVPLGAHLHLVAQVRDHPNKIEQLNYTTDILE